MFEPLTDGDQHPHRWRCSIGISGAYEARQHGPGWGVSHLLSIHRDASMLRTMDGIPPERHLVLTFDDTADTAHPLAPRPEHVGAVCAWIDGLPEDARLLIQCQQGLSRSTAIGLGVLARYRPPEDAGALLHRLRPVAIPNALIVRQWDRTLGLKGALSRVAKRFPCRTWRSAKGAA